MNALLVESIHEIAGRRLQEAGFSVQTRPGGMDAETLASVLPGSQILGIRSKTKVGAALLSPAGDTLAIGCFCIGTDQIDLGAAAMSGVPVFNAPFANTRSVAELTIAEIVLLLRRLPTKIAQMHAGAWDKSAGGAHEIRGKTLGIVGYGHIGSQVSVLAESMGMRVVYHDTAPKLPLGNGRPLGLLDDLLSAADVVTLHVPASPRTERLIGPMQIGKMKPGAILINNARGSVVDVPALAEAIRAGRLGGAAIDVFPVEPESRGDAFDSELRGLDNVILTPHVGGSTLEAQEAIAIEVTDKLVRYIATGATTGAVNVPEVDPPPPERGRGRRGARIVHFHRNVPGVIRQLSETIADAGANITGESLRTAGDLGLVVLDIDRGAEGLYERVSAVAETIRARVIELP